MSAPVPIFSGEPDTARTILSLIATCSTRHPVGTVPEPIPSPGTIRVPRDA